MKSVPGEGISVLFLCLVFFFILAVFFGALLSMLFSLSYAMIAGANTMNPLPLFWFFFIPVFLAQSVFFFWLAWKLFDISEFFRKKPAVHEPEIKMVWGRPVESITR